MGGLVSTEWHQKGIESGTLGLMLSHASVQCNVSGGIIEPGCGWRWSLGQMCFHMVLKIGQGEPA